MDSDNYPETCHAIFIVNNSSAFSAIWRIVRVFVDVGTREKVKVLGSGNPMLVRGGAGSGGRGRFGPGAAGGASGRWVWACEWRVGAGVAAWRVGLNGATPLMKTSNV
jgi:hypothetical protein